MSKKKKAAGIAGGAAAVAAAVALIATTPGSKDVELSYDIFSMSEYVTVMKIDAPEETGADIAELCVNGEVVDKTLLPNGEFKSIPLVFEDLSRLEIRLYSIGQRVGTARFEGETLNAEVLEVGDDV